MFQGLVGRLQKHPLLRIHAVRLALGDTEKRRVERVDALLQEAAPLRHHLARARLRVVPPKLDALVAVISRFTYLYCCRLRPLNTLT